MPEMFNVTSVVEIPADQKILRFSTELNENECVAQQFAAIMANPTPEPGSQEEQVQQFMARLCPAGYKIKIFVHINSELEAI